MVDGRFFAGAGLGGRLACRAGSSPDPMVEVRLRPDGVFALV